MLYCTAVSTARVLVGASYVLYLPSVLVAAHLMFVDKLGTEYCEPCRLHRGFGPALPSVINLYQQNILLRYLLSGKELSRVPI